MLTAYFYNEALLRIVKLKKLSVVYLKFNSPITIHHYLVLGAKILHSAQYVIFL